ncbi:winged helix-turn-helix transcriptional regulator [Streptomyces sp. NPDC052101]|uniref:winged helix-turn-helix transcriptional regulator n=1 Tax=Streptomyces sp. NPDC052101 TaxID=3155763 RepID=UPI00342BBE94
MPRTGTPRDGRPKPTAWGSLPTLTADADLAAALTVLGQKWNEIILHTLATRPVRYGELHTAIRPISTKVLADRLRELVEAELVTHAQPRPGLTTCTAPTPPINHHNPKD